MEISNKKELQEAIITLEKKKIDQRAMMMHHLHATTESLKPGNLLKGAVSKVAHSPSARGSILKTIIGFGVGMITKRMFVGSKSTGFVAKLLGNAIRLGTAKTVMSNADKIKAVGVSIFNNLVKKKKQYSS